MPGAIASAIVGALGITGTAATVASFVISTVISIGLSAATSALFGRKPDQPDFSTEQRDLSQVIRSSVAPRRVVYGQSISSGPLVFAASTGPGHRNLHMVIPVGHGGAYEEIGDVYFNDTLSTDSRFSGKATVAKHLGDPDQAADSSLVSAVADWTVDHRLRGIPYLYVNLTWDADVWLTGIPNVKAVVKGRKVYDPRDAGQDRDDPTTWTWSNNAALCILDWLRADFGADADNDEIDWASWIAAANVCDEDVSIDASTTQKRYTCDGVVFLDETRQKVIDKLLTCCAGALVYTQGTYKLFPGAYRAPTVSLDESDLRGRVAARPRLGRSDLFNRVRGLYMNPDAGWVMDDFPPIENPAYEADDGGERITREIELPFTNDVVRAQRLAKIHLEKSRQALTVEAQFKMTALQVAVMEPVQLSVDLLGFASKVFLPLSWQATEDGGIDLVLQEEARSVYDWNYGEATTRDPAPNTTLPDPFDIEAPGVPSVVEAAYETRDGGGKKTRATVSWDASPSIFVDRYELRYKLITDVDFTVLAPVRETSLVLEDLAPGEYDFWVKALGRIGGQSDYAPAVIDIKGLLAAPSAVTGLEVTIVGTLAFLRFDPHPEIDVREGGTIRFRHSPAFSGVDWTNSTGLGKAAPGKADSWLLPAKPGTYVARAYDATGVPSDTVTTVTTKGATALSFANLDTVTEHPSFGGSHSNTVGVDSVLKLDSAGLWDAEPGNIDDWPDIDSIGGGAETDGTYTFAAGMDFGSVTAVRLRSHLSALAINPLDTIDARTALIDSWADIDGTGDADVDAWVEFRETDDDPAGSPTWSAWQRLDAAEVEARGLQYRARLTNADAAYNIQVDELQVTAEQVS